MMSLWVVCAALLLLISLSDSVVFEPLAGYEPRSVVTSENALDLDQDTIVSQLSLGTVEGIDAAMKVYKEGAYCDPIATLFLEEPLPRPLVEGDEVRTLSSDDLEVKGGVLTNYPKGREVISVRYDIGKVQIDYVGCLVGGNPMPSFEECFPEQGRLVVEGLLEPLSYTYDIAKNNTSGLTIQGLSTESRQRFAVCDDECPFPDYEKFLTYYDNSEYADQWIISAFDGKETQLGRGRADFASMGQEGRFEAVTKATAFWSIWMEVIGQMEEALVECEYVDSVGLSLKKWDSAVAFYTGSLQGQDGRREGLLTYQLANDRCKEFRTCGENGDLTTGISYVNSEVMELFKLGQKSLQQSDCTGAEDMKKAIVQLMLIPMIQSTLKYAYDQSNGLDTSEAAEAAGATFTGAVLPYIHFCDADDAQIIYEHMKVGHEIPPDFSIVKSKLEKYYQACLGISCSDVGGIWDSSQQAYVDDGEPCTDPTYVSRRDRNRSLALLICAAGFALICVTVILSNCCGDRPVAVDENDQPEEVDKQDTDSFVIT